MEPRYSPNLSFLLILLCSAIFSTNILASRLSGQLYDPLVVTLFRWAFVGLALSPYVLFVSRERCGLPRAELRNVVLYAVFGLLFPGLLTFLAGLTTTALNMTIIYSSAPTVIHVMVVLTGAEKIRRLPLIGLLVSTLGVITALYTASSAITGFSIHEGDVLALLGVLSWAFYSVHVAGKASMLALSTRLWLASWLCAAILFFYVLAVGRLYTLGHLTINFFFLTLFVAMIPSVLGYLLHAHLTRTVGVTRVGLMSYLVPITAGAGATLLLSETVHLAQLPAAGMVLLGVWIAGR